MEEARVRLSFRGRRDLVIFCEYKHAALHKADESFPRLLQRPAGN